MHYHNLYNLKFRSELDLSTFGISSLAQLPSPDIEITISKHKKPQQLKTNYLIDKNYGYFNKPGVGLYEVHNGKAIIITPYIDNNFLITETLLNFPIALCMQQRGYYVLHASAVNFTKNTLLFSGESHAGKSTLAAYFVKQGAEMITEDISVMDLSNHPKLLKSPPCLKLSDKSSGFINSPVINIINESVGERKTNIVVQNTKNEYEVGKCYFLKWSETLRCEKLSYEKVLKNLYKFSFLSASEPQNENVFKFLQSVQFFELAIPKSFKSLEQVFTLIESNN